MSQFVIILFIFFSSICFSTVPSLYADDIEEIETITNQSKSVDPALSLSKPKPPLKNYYNFHDPDEINSDIDFDDCLERYINVVFRLSQLTPKLFDLGGETGINSDIYRLDQISKKIQRQISEYKDIDIKYKKKHKPYRNPLQNHFQSIVYRLTVFTPHINQLITNNYDENESLVNLMERIHHHLDHTIDKTLSYQKKLQVNHNQASMPFQPKSPEELAFTLENQMAQSMLNAFGNQSTDASLMGAVGADIASPANADLFNMGGYNMNPASMQRGMQSIQNQITTPNGMPLDALNFMPMF